MRKERYDNKGRLLLVGETQIKNGSYVYRYFGYDGKRKSVTSWRLLPEDEPPSSCPHQECLRDIENRLDKSQQVVHRQLVRQKPCSFDDMWRKYISMKMELSERTLVAYVYLYNHQIRQYFGERPITSITYSTVKKFYIDRISSGQSISSVENMHRVISPVLELAVREGYLDRNPSDGLLRELRRRREWDKTHHEALTKKQAEALVSYAASSYQHRDWAPIITILLGTGMRIGELLGLTWNDINFDRNFISVNHTLNYSVTLDGVCRHYITFPKTNAGARDIPMLSDVRETFQAMYERREDFNYLDQVVVDGYTNFIFRDLSGNLISAQRVNDYLRRVTRDYNEEEEKKAKAEHRQADYLPDFTCHNLRHTFCSLMVLEGMNIKTLQKIMGHAHAETTIRIYTQVTEDRNQEEMASMEGKFKLR